MRNRNRAVAGLALAAVAITGACADVPSTPQPLALEADGPGLFGSPADPSQFASADAEFVRLAQAAPGFGGLYFSDGTLNIYLAPSIQTMSTTETLGALRTRLRAMGIDLDAQPVRIQAGKYDFAQLKSMQNAVSPVLGLEGVLFTDADEAINRVTIGVENAAAAASAERALAMLNVPREAVVLREAKPLVRMQTSLRDRWRPVAGGLQINFPGFLCTLGFNVRSPNRPNVQGFVTNAHCTNVQGTMTRTPYWQPSGSPDTLHANFIAREAHNSPYFTNAQEPRCPVGQQCTWADAAGAVYAPGVENSFGQIYRTTGLGSLTVNTAQPRWNITAERQRSFVGDVMHKTGRTTGWTTGTVTNVCVNTNLGPETYLCDTYVQGSGVIVQGGDSGSPVFRRIGETNDVELNGILWGGSGDGTLWAFSMMQNVRFQNQHAAGYITYPGQTPPAPAPPM